MTDTAGKEAQLWRVVLVASGGGQLLPGQWLGLTDVPMDGGLAADVMLLTRYEDVGLAEPLPQELVFEVQLQAEDADAAIAAAGAVATGLATMISFVINAYIPGPEPHLAYEAAPGLDRRSFWQRHLRFTEGMPRPGRLINETELIPALQAMFGAEEVERLGRAVGGYHAALQHWTVSKKPLALAHLYMALEALGPVFERSERARLGLGSERQHAEYRLVDVDRSNWKNVLLGWIRRDVICKGNKEVYDAARRASDGFEHGSMPLAEFRSAAETYGRPLMDLVRQGVLTQLDLPDEVREKLLDKRPVDVSPTWREVRGYLEGDVGDPDELGESGSPWPHVDWRITPTAASRADGGQLSVSSDYHLTLHCADGVRFMATQHAIYVGLSDADLFDFEPPEETTPVITRAKDSNGGAVAT